MVSFCTCTLHAIGDGTDSEQTAFGFQRYVGKSPDRCRSLQRTIAPGGEADSNFKKGTICRGNVPLPTGTSTQLIINSTSQSKPFQRSGFVTQMGGFDTHNDYREIVNRNFKALNVGLKSFVNEMKAQEVWDDVVVVAVSDFGRKIRPNGRGTDHAWGGMGIPVGKWS